MADSAPERQLGPHNWLVGSETASPAGLLSLNKQPILVQELPPRAPNQPVLSAGAVSVPQSSGPVHADTWEFHKDPWSQYLASKPPDQTSASSVQPRALDAPVTRRFDEQEARLHKLEQGLAAVQEAQVQSAQEAQSTKAALRLQLEETRKETLPCLIGAHSAGKY